MPSLDELKSKWFIPMSGDVLGVPCRRHTEDGGVTQLSVSTDGNTVEPLIDGQSYMSAWHSEIVDMSSPTVTGKEVYHASWRLNEVHTLGGNTGTTSLEDLRAADAGGAAVYALLSNHASDKDNRFNSQPWLEENGVESASLDPRFPLVGSNHQKMSVFKSSEGDMAMLGSIDINTGRWDCTKHPHSENAHPDPLRPHHNPTHDIGVKIIGPATADLDLCFRERWNDTSRTLRMSEQPPLISTRVATGPATGPHSIQVTRTYGLTIRMFGYSWYDRGEFTTWASYLNAILKATKYIYIEDQYFLPWGFPPRFSRGGADQPGRDVDIVYQLGEALKRGVNVAVLVPRESEDWGFVNNITEFQRDLGINYLRRISDAGSPGQIVVTHIHNGTGNIFVHSKLMLVDDEFTLIGQTNVGARSMTHDGEVHVGIVDGGADNQPGVFTRELRKTLWAEHTGRDRSVFESPAAGFFAFRDSSTSVPPGRLREYATDANRVFPLPQGASLPPGHQWLLRNFIDPYAGPAALA